jgi:hypothetical protein
MMAVSLPRAMAASAMAVQAVLTLTDVGSWSFRLSA